MVKPVENLRIVGYARVSSNAQAEADTIEAQRDGLTRWAKANGHKLVRICEDEAVSGKLDAEARPGLSCVIDAIENDEADAVVMLDLFRFARQLTVQEATLALIWSRGGRVFTYSDGLEVLADDPSDPMRTALRQIVGAIGQLEASLIRKRLEDGRARKAAAGGYAGHGSPAFGQRAKGGELVVDQGEAEAVKVIASMHAEGASLRSIANELAAKGIKSKRGGAWHPTTIKRVIERAGGEMRPVGHNTPAAAAAE